MVAFMKNFKVIDFMKLCMACFVVAIHTNPENIVGCVAGQEIIRVIYNIAVPYFFLTSGFLLFGGISDASNTIRIHKYLLKICRLYVVWTLLYLPFTIWGFANEHMSLGKSMLVFTRNFLLVGENWYSWPLWYLLALIIAVFIVWRSLSWGLKVKQILLIAVLLHVLGLWINYCHCNGTASNFIEMYYALFKTTRNGIFIGLLYITLGILAACKKEINKNMLIIGMFIGFLGSLFHVPFGDVLFAYAVFALTLKLELHLIPVGFCTYMRKLSSIIYFMHMYWVVLWGSILPYSQMKALYLFTLSLLSSAIGGMILLKFKNKSWFRFCFQ